LKDEIEQIMEKVHYAKLFDNWVQNFALNLNNIWNEPSARELSSIQNKSNEPSSAIIIGKGPSLKKENHLKLLAESGYTGTIICCDGILIDCLKAGVTPEKFPKFFVVSIEARNDLKKYYDHDLVRKHGKNIFGLFSTVSDPTAIDFARKSGINIHWFHALFDYYEGKKSFNNISALMTRSKKHTNGLPGLQTGGNVGTTSWFIAWQILKCKTVTLIGIDHGWNIDDPSSLMILAHGGNNTEIDESTSSFRRLFPQIYNPEFDCTCVVDPIFQYYGKALKEFIKRSPEWLNTINATEGGTIFGDRILCTKFSKFFKDYII
jgi:hypothetical protein